MATQVRSVRPETMARRELLELRVWRACRVRPVSTEATVLMASLGRQETMVLLDLSANLVRWACLATTASTVCPVRLAIKVFKEPKAFKVSRGTPVFKVQWAKTGLTETMDFLALSAIRARLVRRDSLDLMVILGRPDQRGMMVMLEFPERKAIQVQRD
jgi:hypothetical protein